MASTFSPQLRIELIGAGEQAGAWNNTTNTNLGTLIEQAISGVAAVSVSSSSYTLTTANGATDQARSMVLNVTGTPGSAFNVICPTSSKVYIAKNGTTGGFAMTLKTAAGSGITIPNGRTMLLYCDGTNVVNGVNELPTGATLNGEVIATLTGTETLTNKTLTAPKFADGGFIADANGNEMVVFDTVATAVNELTISNAATTGSPAIYATGGDTNINVNLVPKGTGVVQATGVEVATISGTQALSNKTIVSPANVSATTGNAAILAATGPDTNININLTPKGSGVVNATTVASFTAGSASAPSITPSGDLNTGIWFPAADTIAFATNGTEDFRIGSAGQLGISGANYGTSGQVLTSGGASAAPAWASVGSGVPDVIIEDQKSSGTVGGTATTGAWTKRTLNTLARNNGTIASLASDEFTLPAGTYYVTAQSPFYYMTGVNRIRLYNVTDASVTKLGRNAWSSGGNSPDRPNLIDASLNASFTISDSKTFRIEYYVASTLGGSSSLGVASSLGTEIYTTASIWKL